LASLVGFDLVEDVDHQMRARTSSASGRGVKVKVSVTDDPRRNRVQQDLWDYFWYELVRVSAPADPGCQDVTDADYAR
jgi:hypothetical protein